MVFMFIYKTEMLFYSYQSSFLALEN